VIAQAAIRMIAVVVGRPAARNGNGGIACNVQEGMERRYRIIHSIPDKKQQEQRGYGLPEQLRPVGGLK